VPIKYVLKKAGIIQSDSVRLPLCQLEAKTEATLDRIIAEITS
jgi:dihydrodipicolinate synthase/N-acetylneuraminate lyase